MRPFVLHVYRRRRPANWPVQTYLIYTFEEGFARLRSIGKGNISHFKFCPLGG